MLPSTATAQISAYGNANWLATVRPRIGWAANNWLLYATGGVAVTNFKDDFALSGTTAAGNVLFTNNRAGLITSRSVTRSAAASRPGSTKGGV